MPLVMKLGNWVDLSPEPEVYRCRLCRSAVSLGNTGMAISQPGGTWLYEHYSGECAAPPIKLSKKRRKAVSK